MSQPADHDTDKKAYHQKSKSLCYDGEEQRLPNGDTLICDGINGTLFEVTTDGQIVWEYVNPVINTGPLSSTAVIPPDPTHAGQYLNEIFRVTRYAPDYAGLAGKDLAATGTLVK